MRRWQTLTLSLSAVLLLGIAHAGDSCSNSVSDATKAMALAAAKSRGERFPAVGGPDSEVYRRECPVQWQAGYRAGEVDGVGCGKFERTNRTDFAKACDHPNLPAKFKIALPLEGGPYTTPSWYSSGPDMAFSDGYGVGFKHGYDSGLGTCCTPGEKTTE